MKLIIADNESMQQETAYTILNIEMVDCNTIKILVEEVTE